MGICEFVTLTLFILFFLAIGAKVREIYIEKTKVFFGATYTNGYCNVYVQGVENGNVVFYQEDFEERHIMSIERFIAQFRLVK